jgi:hypothetical protein
MMKKMKTILLFLLFSILASLNGKSQNLYEFGFERDFKVTVLNQDDDTLKHAWWGGLNAVHVHNMDINLDGVNGPAVV